MSTVTTPRSDAPDPLRDIESHKIDIREPQEVRAYLARYGHLVGVVAAALDQIRREFGAATSLHLEVYRDPEIDDRYLALRVRLPDYDATVMDRIERANQSFEGKITPDAGYFLVTTDFQPFRE